MKRLMFITGLGLFTVFSAEAQLITLNNTAAENYTLAVTVGNIECRGTYDISVQYSESVMINKRKKKGTEGLKLGGELGGVVPFDDFKKIAGPGFSGGGMFRYFNENIALGADAELHYFGPPSELNEDLFRKANAYIIRVLIGGEYYFGNKVFRPYAGIGVGPYLLKISRTSKDGNYSDESDAQLGAAPKIGFYYDFDEYFIFNFNVCYNGIMGVSEKLVFGTEKVTRQGKSLFYLGINAGLLLNIFN